MLRAPLSLTHALAILVTVLCHGAPPLAVGAAQPAQEPPPASRSFRSLVNDVAQGQVIELDGVELSLTIPDIAGADRVYPYRPRWTGTEHLLESFGQVRVGP